MPGPAGIARTVRDMASYPREVEFDGGSDRAFALTHEGFVTLFHDQTLMDNEVGWLRDSGYRVADFDAEAWVPSPEAVFGAFSAAFGFPYYSGHNFDALRDSLRDIEVPSGATGIVLILRSFDTFSRAWPDDAHCLLDVLEAEAREQMMFGDRWIMLVQSHDPQLRPRPIGGYTPRWSQQEFLDKARGLQPRDPPRHHDAPSAGAAE